MWIANRGARADLSSRATTPNFLAPQQFRQLSVVLQTLEFAHHATRFEPVGLMSKHPVFQLA
jgi:hypothetical protein